MSSTTTSLYSVQQKRRFSTTYGPNSNTETEEYQIVSYFDESNSFRGPAIFETKNQAKQYLKIYEKRMQDRNRIRMLHELKASYNKAKRKKRSMK